MHILIFHIKYKLYEYFLKDDNILIINSIDIEKEVNILLSQDDDMLSIKKYLDNI
jgi:hypothetical protein